MNPCKNCICIAVCRHKKFNHLFKQCKTVQIYVEHFSNDNIHTYERLRIVEKSLNPSKWSAQYNLAPTVIEGAARYYIWVEDK